jgi:hypothetical protein
MIHDGRIKGGRLVEDHQRKPLDYAPAGDERRHVWQMSLRDWILAFAVAALIVVVGGIDVHLLAIRRLARSGHSVRRAR